MDTVVSVVDGIAGAVEVVACPSDVSAEPSLLSPPKMIDDGAWSPLAGCDPFQDGL